MLRSQSKCTQNVIGGCIGGKMIRSPQFTQDVPTGFQVTSPPVFGNETSIDANIHARRATVVVVIIIVVNLMCPFLIPSIRLALPVGVVFWPTRRPAILCWVSAWLRATGSFAGLEIVFLLLGLIVMTEESGVGR